METLLIILIAVIVVGIAAMVIVLRKNASAGGTGNVELSTRLEEREAAFEREMTQRLEAQKALYETKLDEQKARMQAELDAEKSLSQSRKESAEEALAERDRAHRREIERLEGAHKEAVATLERKHAEAMLALDERHKQAIDSMQARFAESAATMSEQLKNVTEEMLKQRQTEFAESSNERIGKLLNPLEATIKEMRQAVADNTTRHTELGGQLDSSLKSLLNHTLAAQASADKLATALRGSNKVQGEWGETVLRELLESQGLTEGIHFETQATMTDASGRTLYNDDGSRMRPDVLLNLDQNRVVIIDSKVSLSAYLDYLDAETDEARDLALKEHINSLQRHVRELARKDYSSYVKPPKTRIDYVIMFVPNTAALLLATSNRTDLWRKAMEENVYIADEQTLYAALRIINMTWKQIEQARNHEKVFELAEEMLERTSQFMQKFADIGKKLDDAKKAYDAGEKKLQEGGRSIPQTCRKLIKLGATPSKTFQKLPPELLAMPDDLLPDESDD